MHSDNTGFSLLKIVFVLETNKVLAGTLIFFSLLKQLLCITTRKLIVMAEELPLKNTAKMVFFMFFV